MEYVSRVYRHNYIPFVSFTPVPVPADQTGEYREKEFPPTPTGKSKTLSQMLIVSIILRNLTHSPLDRKIEKYIKEICFQKENGRSSSFSHRREKNFGNLDRKFDEEARFSSFLDPFP